ncbi:MAG: hypothetical protein JRJ45_07930 [Deltaproteobacteria bacterium]|nr:hypothetical protein [Deltaproteobacteria bacterium]
MRINPFIMCIAGHSVNPYGDLQEQFPNLLFITLLRNPLMRYLSRFQYLIDKMGKRFTFDEFLTYEEESNFQIKKIAGNESLDMAKAILKNSFLVGVVEEFDEFLVLLKKKLEPRIFDPRYEIKNITKDKRKRQNFLEMHKDYIVQRNQIDIELYRYVKEDLLPKAKNAYGLKLEKDINNFRRANRKGPVMTKRHIDYICRKLYYEPITGFIRCINGMKAKGSY